MSIEHKVIEQTAITKRSERWHGKAEGYGFWLIRDSDGGVRLGAQPIDYREAGKIPLFDCFPKSVADIEHMADELPRVFKAIARELRDAGLDDLRSRWDKWSDARKKWEEHYNKTGEWLPYPEIEKEDGNG